MILFNTASVASDYKVIKIKLICVPCLFSTSLPLYKTFIFHLKMTEEGEGEGTDAGEVETHSAGELIKGASELDKSAYTRASKKTCVIWHW